MQTTDSPAHRPEEKWRRMWKPSKKAIERYFADCKSFIVSWQLIIIKIHHLLWTCCVNINDDDMGWQKREKKIAGGGNSVVCIETSMKKGKEKKSIRAIEFAISKLFVRYVSTQKRPPSPCMLCAHKKIIHQHHQSGSHERFSIKKKSRESTQMNVRSSEDVYPVHSQKFDVKSLKATRREASASQKQIANLILQS